ncbi:MAG: hypothetical protein K0R57_3770 [Paenibacillaceae bacterium]|nr:hypothetical protein [Paenibacillaceae bacterium]
MNQAYLEAAGADSPGNPFRKRYAEALEELVVRRQQSVDQARAAYIDPHKLYENKELYRRDFIQMLGWPLNEYTFGEVRGIQTIHAGHTETADIYRLQLEAWPSLPFYGILFVPSVREDKIPLVISQHGGQGTPELCSSLFGSSENYHQMTQRILSRGAAVFAPQLLLWDKEKYGVMHDRQQTDVRLKQLGGSIAAVEIACLRRCLDYLCTQLPFVDAARIGMAGLSYGGFYTLFTAAAEPRIKAAYSSCFFNSRYAYPWQDWVWQGSAGRFLDAEVAALIAPRALYIEVADQDELFAPDGAISEYNRLAAYYQAQNASHMLRFEVFAGNHELNSADAGMDFLFSHL